MKDNHVSQPFSLFYPFTSFYHKYLLWCGWHMDIVFTWQEGYLFSANARISTCIVLVWRHYWLGRQVSTYYDYQSTATLWTFLKKSRRNSTSLFMQALFLHCFHPNYDYLHFLDITVVFQLLVYPLLQSHFHHWSHVRHSPSEGDWGSIMFVVSFSLDSHCLPFFK